MLTRGSLDERTWELLRKKGAASRLALDGQLIDRPEQKVDWGMVLREMRAAGVKAVGDELAETDIERLWLAAEGPYAPLAPPATVIPLADQLAAEGGRPDATAGARRGGGRPARLRPRRLSSRARQDAGARLAGGPCRPPAGA